MKNKKKLPMNIVVLLIYVTIILILLSCVGYCLLMKIPGYINRKINSNERINSLTGLYHMVADIAEQNNITLAAKLMERLHKIDPMIDKRAWKVFFAGVQESSDIIK